MTLKEENKLYSNILAYLITKYSSLASLLEWKKKHYKGEKKIKKIEWLFFFLNLSYLALATSMSQDSPCSTRAFAVCWGGLFDDSGLPEHYVLSHEQERQGSWKYFPRGGLLQYTGVDNISLIEHAPSRCDFTHVVFPRGQPNLSTLFSKGLKSIFNSNNRNV